MINESECRSGFGLMMVGLNELKGNIPIYETKVEKGDTFRENLDILMGILDHNKVAGILFLDRKDDIETYKSAGWSIFNEEMMVRPPKGMTLEDFREKYEIATADVLR